MKPILNNASPNLIRLLQGAKAHQSLLDIAKNVLPDDISEHVIGISFEENDLIIMIDHEIWGTQLRFYEQSVLDRFHDNFQHLQLQRMKVKVIARKQQREATKFVRKGLQESSAKAFIETSEKVESSKLRDALKRLSQHRIED